MHRVDTPSAAATLPTSEAPGTPGYFTKGNPVGAIEATVPGQDFFNMLQEEMVRVVEDAGLTPDATKADFTQLSQAIQILTGSQALGAMDFPTIDTADNRAGVTGAIATNGGTVSIPANVVLSLGEEDVAGESGRTKKFKTVAFTSADLAISSTYYLRARVTAGALEIYTQQGTDVDTIPGGLVGTPDGGSGGGFDSTVLDVLFAKVVTGTAGTVPTVTDLANNKRLDAAAAFTFAVTATSVQKTMTIDWARTPTQHDNLMVGYNGQDLAALSAPTIAHTQGMQHFLFESPITGRYSCSINTEVYDTTSITGENGVEIKIKVSA